MITTFLLTVLIDLTVAIEIGMILAAFLFMRSMMKTSSVSQIDYSSDNQDEDVKKYDLPEGIDVFEINGPLFFGAAYKFKDAMKLIAGPAKVLIIRMKNVPIIDATGIRVLKDVSKEVKANGTKLILTEVSSEQVLEELKRRACCFKLEKEI